MTVENIAQSFKLGFSEAGWAWYYAHKDEEVLTIKIYKIFSYTVRYKQLYIVFEKLFGKEKIVPLTEPVA